MRLAPPTVLLIAFLSLGTLAAAQGFYDRTILRTIDLQFSQTDWDQQLRDNKSAGLQVYIPADMTVDGVLYPNVGVRYKGNSTYWSLQPGQKKPINIDMNVFTVGQDLMGHSKLVLNNQAFDPSIMREVIAYKVMNQFIPSSRANFIKLVINGDNYGIYTNIEHVGKELCEDRFGSDGFRYKAIPPWSWPDTLTAPPPPGDLALQDINGSVARAEVAYQLKNMETDPNHHLGILSAIDALNNTQSDLLLDALNPFFDTDHAIWHLALNNVLCSLDAYYSTGQNYYLFQDPRHNRLVILPWDYNMSFGIYGAAGTTLSPTAGKGVDERPVLSKLVKGSALRQEYLAHVNTAALQGLNPALIHAEIDALQALIDAEVQIDTRLALSYQGWLAGVSTLKNFVQNRHDFLETHSLLAVERPHFTVATHSPAKPTSGDRVKFLAQVDNLADPVKSVFAYVRVQGAFHEVELLDDGLNGDGAANDGLFAGGVPPFLNGSKVEYYFHANCENSKGVSFSPEEASTNPYSFVVTPGAIESDLLINEFVASNNSGPVDENGEHEDWIELHNNSTLPVDVTGMWLSDDLQDPLKWQFPVGTFLDPGQTLLIWADGEPLDGPLHTNFRLSSGGEDLCLLDSDGQTFLDLLSFGAQESDVSTSRFVDGGDLWVTTPNPTPGATNQISCGARSYDALDSLRNIASLSLSGNPSPGTTIALSVDGLNANQFAQMQIGLTPETVDHQGSGLTALVGNVISQFAITADPSGHVQLDFTIPANSALIGQRYYLQAGALGPNPLASHGLEIVICP